MKLQKKILIKEQCISVGRYRGYRIFNITILAKSTRFHSKFFNWMRNYINFEFMYVS